jgi:uncharacterized surface protein with fasciclin (FAS1) repeats
MNYFKGFLAVLFFGVSRAHFTVVSPNNTILENLHALAFQQGEYNASVNYISLLLGLNASCTSDLSAMLNSTDGNYTFFAPNDDAFRAVSGFPNFGSNYCETCSNSSSSSSSNGNGNNNINGNGIIGRNRNNMNMNNNNNINHMVSKCNDSSLAFNATSSELMPCLPQMLQYHLLNETLFFNSTRFGFLNASSYNYTVLPTFLNSSSLVNLSGNDSEDGNNNQVLVFNISNSNGNGNDNGQQDDTSVNFTSPFNVSILHGINPVANVTLFDIPSSNGILHVIDRLLIPPANLTATINATYMDENDNISMNPSVSFLNRTDLEMYANMSGITVFLPSAQSNQTDLSSFNVSNYIFPELFYNNRSFELVGNLSENVFFQQNLTNLNGEIVPILFGRDNSMLFNGSRVIQPNILMKNGVLHIFDSSEASFLNGNNSDDSVGIQRISSSLGRIMRQFIN